MFRFYMFYMLRKAFCIILIFFCLWKTGFDKICQADEISLPYAAETCINRANFLIRGRKIHEAIDILQSFQQKGIKADKDTIFLNGYSHYYIDFMLGNCFLMLNENSMGKSNVVSGENRVYLEKAANKFEKSLNKEPEFNAAWLNLARCRYDMNQLEEAGFCFSRAYETSLEKDSTLLYYAAICYSSKGKYPLALECFNKLLTCHPDKIETEWLPALVHIFLALNQNSRALPWIERLAVETSGSRQKNWREMLLYQYIVLKMNQKALDYATFLTRTEPFEARWWKALTNVFLNVNQLEKGLSSLLVFSYIFSLSDQEILLMADLYMACNIPLVAASYYEKWIDRQKDGDHKSNVVDKSSLYKGEEQSDQIQEQIRNICKAYCLGGEISSALAWIDRGLARKNDSFLLRLKADLLFDIQKYKAAYEIH